MPMNRTKNLQDWRSSCTCLLYSSGYSFRCSRLFPVENYWLYLKDLNPLHPSKKALYFYCGTSHHTRNCLTLIVCMICGKMDCLERPIYRLLILFIIFIYRFLFCFLYFFRIIVCRLNYFVLYYSCNSIHLQIILPNQIHYLRIKCKIFTWI